MTTAPSPATTQSSTSTTTTSPVTPESSTAVVNITTPANSTHTSPETPASTSTTSSSITSSNATVTVGPPPSSPTSISSSVPPNTSPGSSTVLPSGNTTTLSPSTTTPGVTNHTTEVTTLTPSTTPTRGNTTASPTTAPSITNTTAVTTAVTTLRPTEITTNPNSTTSAPPIPTLGPVIVCPALPCPLDSVCLNHTCQCLSGSFLQDNRCIPAQVFPGQLHFMSLTFQPEMYDRSSSIFKETAGNISAALGEILGTQTGYIRSDVVELQNGSVQASVNNIFKNTSSTQESVNKAIDKAIESGNSNGFFTNVTFVGIDLCKQIPFPCDDSTANCRNENGQAFCSCQSGFVSIVYSNTSCRACPSGERVVDDKCEACPFGYSGFNCNDSSLLAVVVISCVLGGILLIMVLALIIFFCWRRCSDSKADYSSSPYSSNVESNMPWPVGVTPIPRATTNWDATPAMEMTEGGSNRAPVDTNPHRNGGSGSYDLNPEPLRTFKGKHTSHYSSMFPTGHENPYFIPGDGKNN
ncbi:protein HEG homolog 1 [Hippoglossus hippoglossus]|uniref:protein HEG homolog 1 n=1 Tax=Hippoglossus hippoglossus TaxID=8267 RepID=UPI00148D3FFD|nr:protein HEG homolog 1 [Hippoglossus hippoglossus]